MHPAFVPMLTIWGGAVAGLAMLALAPETAARITAANGLGILGDILGEASQIGLAALAAICGAGFAFLAARSFKKIRNGEKAIDSIATKASRRVRPIDPAIELGSESLDTPIEEAPFGDLPTDTANSDPASDIDELMLCESQICEPAPEPIEVSEERSDNRGPTLGELAARGYEPEPRKKPVTLRGSDEDEEPRFTRRHFKAALIETCESVSDAASVAEPERAENGNDQTSREGSDAPRELDLAEFAELPGRNAVWIEDNAAAPSAPETVRPAPSAIEKLRQVPPQELSLVQMVERFAAALHDYQATQRSPVSQHGQESARRDVALAEALKALTLFTEDGFNQSPTGANDEEASAIRDTTRELRDALAKLQTLRGAA